MMLRQGADLLPAWRVFDPMGSGVLSLTEVQAAFALFGDNIQALDVQYEFERLDTDDSGSIELREFGPLLQRLAADGAALGGNRSERRRSLAALLHPAMCEARAVLTDEPERALGGERHAHT